MRYWFTDQPGAGKTTLAFELIKHIDNSISNCLLNAELY